MTFCSETSHQSGESKILKSLSFQPRTRDSCSSSSRELAVSRRRNSWALSTATRCSSIKRMHAMPLNLLLVKKSERTWSKTLRTPGVPSVTSKSNITNRSKEFELSKETSERPRIRWQPRKPDWCAISSSSRKNKRKKTLSSRENLSWLSLSLRKYKREIALSSGKR